MTDGRQLLADYVATGSEAAFRELVARYIDLVYSAAFRLVDNDAHLAEDVCQTVFADLARMGGKLSRDVMLGGWLHRHTCFVARTTLRGERRRQLRERQVAEMHSTEDHSAANLASLAPLLDDAIDQLGSEDRDAILLRFFEQRDFRAVGEALGTNDDTARKRVSRALDKLHSLLKRRGVALSAAALASTLTAKAVSAAPAGLSLTVSTAVLSGAAAGSGSTLTFLKIMSMTKLKVAIVGGLAAALAIPLVLEHQSNTRLTAENEALRQKSAQVDRLTSENQRLASLADAKSVAAAAPAANTNDQMELLRLRAEVGRLRLQSAAAGGSNGPSLLSGITASPEMFKMIREQQKSAMSAIYQGLTNQISLTTDQRERLNELLADDVMENIDHITSALREKKSADEMKQMFADQQAILLEKVQAILGPEGLAEYQDYTKNLGSHLTAGQFSSKFSGSTSEKGAKKKQLFQLMQEESQQVLASAGLPADYQMVPSMNFLNIASEEEGERSLKLLQDVYERVAARAGGFMDQTELEKFNEFKDSAIRINRMSLIMNRKMMAPASQ